MSKPAIANMWSAPRDNSSIQRQLTDRNDIQRFNYSAQYNTLEDYSSAQNTIRAS